MIEDSFHRWYKETYPDLNILLDDMAEQLFEAYRAGWKQHMELEEMMNKIVAQAQEDGFYDY